MFNWKKLMFYALVTYYNIKVGILLVLGVIFNGKKILEVKERSKPAILDKYRHKTALINGLNLHYVEAGDQSKPLMLFVHGFPEFWYSWRFQLEEFSKDYWCVAFDMRGYGESDKPSGLHNYTIDNLVKDIRELVRHLGRDKFTLVCHDWGAVIGFQYIMQHMDTLTTYIMMSGPPREVHRLAAASDKDQFKKMWYIYFFQGPRLPEMMLRSNDLAVFKELRSEHTTDADIEAFKYTFGKEGAFTAPINYYRANMLGTPNKTKPESYEKGLFLLGDKDKYISSACGPLAEKRIPNLKFQLLENTDHFCQQTNPNKVNEVMRKFLKEQQ